MPLSHHAWTTVIVYTLGATRLFSKDYNTYKTALRATSSTLHHDRHHYLYFTSYIGYRSRVGYATNYAAWCTESTTTLLLHTYLSELCVPCSDTRLWSTTQGNYMIPRTHRHLANSAFAVAAPSCWNSLPDNVRDSERYSNFLSKLKTHYFNIAFYNHIIC